MDETSDEMSEELLDSSIRASGASTSDSRNGHNTSSSNPAGRGRKTGGASNEITVTLQQVPELGKRKRPLHPSATLAKSAIEEQKLLWLSLEEARGQEFTLREQELKIQAKALALQEKLAKS